MRGSMREKRPGYWELRVYAGYDARTRRSLYVSECVAGTRRQAETALAALVGKAEQGKRRPARGTLTQFLSDWLAGLTGLSPATLRAYAGEVNGHIVPALGHIDVTRLSVRDVDGFYRALTRQGLAPASVRHAHAVLRRALDDAVRWEWRADNPASAARLPSMRRDEIEPPTLEVARGLLDAADAEDPAWGALVRLALASGARRGELCALRWSDYEPPQLRIARSVTLGRAEKDTKRHRSRKVTLDTDTLGRLDAHRRRMQERAERADLPLRADAFLFSGEVDCRLPHHPDYISHRFAALAERCGCPEVRLHDLRHLSNSLLLAAGVPVPTVQRRHGHASGQMTFDVYGHALGDGDGQAAELMGSLLAGPRRDEGRPT